MGYLRVFHFFQNVFENVAGPGLGPRGGGVGYLGVFHICLNAVENVKSRFSKCQNVRNPNVENVKSGFSKCKNVRDPDFPKRTKSEIFKKYGLSKFRDFLRDAECQ